MKIAIQQPYFYPYLGYFELIKNVDKFVFLNDAQYIRRGWVNRNRISKDFYITVPINKSKRSSKINEIEINYDFNWHYKHCKTLENFYGKKIYNNPVYIFYKNIPKYNFIVDLLKDSIKNVCEFLNIKTEFIDSEDFQIPEEIKGKNRIIEICNILDAEKYYNLPGGCALYSKDFFMEKNIELNFMENKSTVNF